MKKLLSIVLLALALCLAISAAFAVEGKPTEYQNVFANPWSVRGPVVLTDGTTVELQGFDDNNWAQYYEYRKDAANHDKVKTFQVLGVEEPAELGASETLRVVEIRVRIGHVYDYSEDTPDCTKGGTVKCTVCGYEFTTTPTEHLYELRKEVVKETYCTAPVFADVCTRCGHELEGSREYYAKNDEYLKNYKPHTNEELKAKEKVTEKWVLDGELNCMVKENTYHVTCSQCGKTLLDAEGKERKDIKIDLAGYVENQKNFGVKLEEGWEGHDWDKWVKQSDATCVDPGTRKHWCKICNQTVVEEDEKDPAKGVEWTLNGLTCDMYDDWDEVLVCKYCNGDEGEGHYVEVGDVEINRDYEDAKGKPGISFEYDGVTYVVYHQLDMEYAKNNIINNLVPVCQEARYGRTFCTRCDDRWFYVEVAPKADHNWGDWVLVEDKAVTGTDTSRWESYCLNDGCPEYRVRALADKPVDPCAEDAHEWGIKDPKSVKCGENKDVEFECTICKATKTEDYTKAHNFSKVEVITEPTCTEPGVSLKTCADCGVMEKGEIAALGHKWDEGKVTKEATTEAAGEKTFTCTVCGATKTEEIAKLVAPTAYTTNFEFDSEEMTLTGTATHTEGTEEAGKPVYARVTYFMADGTYIVVSVPVEADGSFESMNSGNVIHVSVQIVDSAKVRPGEFNRFGGSEKDVK